MTKKSRPTWLTLFLLLSACATPDPTPRTPEPTVPPALPVCNLVACPLPGRAPLGPTEDAYQALDATEAALVSCANTVLACIAKENVARAAAMVGAPKKLDPVEGQ